MYWFVVFCYIRFLEERDFLIHSNNKLRLLHLAKERKFFFNLEQMTMLGSISEFDLAVDDWLIYTECLEQYLELQKQTGSEQFYF